MNSTVSISSSYYDDSDHSVMQVFNKRRVVPSQMSVRQPLARSTPISRTATTSTSLTPGFTPLNSRRRFDYRVLRRRLFHRSSSACGARSSSSSGLGSSAPAPPQNPELRQEADGCEQTQLAVATSNATYTVLPANYKSSNTLLDRVSAIKLDLPMSRISKSRKLMIRNRFKNINRKQLQSLGVV